MQHAASVVLSSLPTLDRPQHVRSTGCSALARTAHTGLSGPYSDAAVAARSAAIRCKCEISGQVNSQSADQAAVRNHSRKVCYRTKRRHPIAIGIRNCNAIQVLTTTRDRYVHFAKETSPIWAIAILVSAFKTSQSTPKPSSPAAAIANSSVRPRNVKLAPWPIAFTTSSPLRRPVS